MMTTTSRRRRRIRMPTKLAAASPRLATSKSTLVVMLLLLCLLTCPLAVDSFLLTRSSAPATTSVVTGAALRNDFAASIVFDRSGSRRSGGDRGGADDGASFSAASFWRGNNNVPKRHNSGRLQAQKKGEEEESDKDDGKDDVTTGNLAVNDKNDSRKKKSSNDTSKINNNDSNNNNMDWKAIRQQAVLFQQMALPYYQESKTGRWLLVALLCLTIVNSGVSVVFSYLGKDFWNALSDKNVDEFYTVLRNYCGALLLGAPLVTLYTFQREQLAVHWREWMTARTFQLYTSNRVYYNLQRSFTSSASSSSSGSDLDSSDDTDENDGINSSSTSSSTTSSSVSSNSIDNPDQRISEDVNSFTSYSLQLVITVLTSLIDLVAFSTILWGIYPQLFLAIIAYAAFGTITTTLLGRSLVPLNFAQLQKEADLRYSLVRLRDNAESIAFYAGEDLEGQAVERRLERVMDNKRQIIVKQRNLELFTNSYRYLVQILPVAVVAPQYFAGSIALGVISQSVGAFNHILSDLSIIVNQFERLSSFSAGIARLSSFYQAMQTVNHNSIYNKAPAIAAALEDDDNGDAEVATVSQPVPSLLQLVDTNKANGASQHAAANNSNIAAAAAKATASSGYGMIQLQKFRPFEESITGNHNEQHIDNDNNLVLEIEHLDLVTPDFQQRLLIQDLNLQLFKQQHLLIVGNSGAGKSSLLRAVAGLWTVGNGRIARPHDDDVYFLPQRPYCTLGSLKDQLLYPSIEREHGELQHLQEDVRNGDSSSSSSRDKKEGASGQKIVPQAHWLKQTISDDDLLRVLEQVDLLDLAKSVSSNNKNAPGDKGLNTVLDWSNVLSLGEQQRLAFARVLVNRPRLVILDEATSALDLIAEARMYGLLQKLSSEQGENNESSLSPLQRRIPGLTYISVGHRPSLLKYHDKRLRLKGTAGFELEDIEKSTSSTALSSFDDDFSSSTTMDQQVSNL
jgi:ABC-type uncharacterized transport system fused permease/ATPase subunit